VPGTPYRFGAVRGGRWRIDWQRTIRAQCQNNRGRGEHGAFHGIPPLDANSSMPKLTLKFDNATDKDG